MKLYVQLMILFVISLIGEGISVFFHLPIPGSIIGLIILFFSLTVQMASDATCQHGWGFSLGQHDYPIFTSCRWDYGEI